MLRMSYLDIKLLEEKAKIEDENARRASSIVYQNNQMNISFYPKVSLKLDKRAIRRVLSIIR
ncbi:hypothetical protein F7984_01560 [Pradoshia sp. D12]|uniref:hypothetical protein n=1 Tax=Bacillaceae TaxID=186817 RepID=UPI00080AFAC5|nr:MULTISPECIES: hypothetical protein [Bacillaceae]OCA80750.1 hypothetical protein A8L44_16410 [Bacillus sp. FJAT-27986]QFK70041.1 hypothetical protein F7984_01560 [Pradoshia sp. D12]TPF70601.1 hypothetical protein FHY44_16695 [Bacillus sp. D12]